MRPRVTFTSHYYHGGLGDFFGGALSLYAFVRSRADFQISLRSDYPLSTCFKFAPFPSTPSQRLILNATPESTVDPSAAKAKVDAALAAGENLTVITNMANFSDGEVAIPEFMKFVQPTDAVLRRQKELLGVLAGRGPYVSLHVRCGDGYNGSAVCPDDRRLDPELAFGLVLEAAFSLGEDRPIIFHTDNAGLRERVAAAVPEVICLPTAIQHTGEPGGAVLDTVAEFLIVGGAEKIYYFVDSGFTRLPAQLFGVPRVRI